MNKIKTQVGKKLTDEGQTQDWRSAYATPCLDTEQRRGHMEDNLLGLLVGWHTT